MLRAGSGRGSGSPGAGPGSGRSRHSRPGGRAEPPEGARGPAELAGIPARVRGGTRIPRLPGRSPGEEHPAHLPVRSARLLYLGPTLVSCDSKALSFIESLVMYRGWYEQEIPNLARCVPRPIVSTNLFYFASPGPPKVEMKLCLPASLVS